MRKEQLCWKCKKSTNMNLCDWVKFLEHPKDCKIDEEGFIEFCPNFEKEYFIKSEIKILDFKKIVKQQRYFYKYMNAISKNVEINSKQFRKFKKSYEEELKK